MQPSCPAVDSYHLSTISFLLPSSETCVFSGHLPVQRDFCFFRASALKKQKSRCTASSAPSFHRLETSLTSIKDTERGSARVHRLQEDAIPLGSPLVPRHRSAVGSQGGAFFYKRGNPAISVWGDKTTDRCPLLGYSPV